MTRPSEGPDHESSPLEPTGASALASNSTSDITVAAVVVSYGHTPALVQCLEALSKAHSIRQTVVVNNKRDMDVTQLARNLDVVPVEPPTNLGYARGGNLGASAISVPHDVIAIVNPDVTINDDFEKVAALVPEADAAIISARLANSDGSLAINWRPPTTPVRELLAALFGTRVYIRPGRRPPDTAVHVPQADGALLLVTRRTWDRLGGFDERYELYYEDVDLCRRAQPLGGVLLAPEVVGTHIGGESYERNRSAAYVALRISRHRYLRKWHGPLGSLTALTATVLELLSRTAAGTAEGPLTRWHAVRCEVTEARRAGSCSVLESGGHSVDSPHAQHRRTGVRRPDPVSPMR